MTWVEDVLSPEFQAAVVRKRRRIGHRVEMIDASWNHAADLPVTSGSVNYDGTIAEAYAASLTITSKKWIPTGARSILDPRSGHLCRIWWRMQKPDLSDWWEIPLATVKLGKPRISVSRGRVSMTITGRDLLAVARRRGYADKVLPVGGLTVTDALRTLYTTVAPDLPVTIGASSVLLPAVYELAEEDPAKDWEAIAAAGAMVTRENRLGQVTVAPPVWPQTVYADLSQGPDCPVVTLDREVEDDLYNWVRAVSTNPAVVPAVESIVMDNDPGSPTYVGGAFGVFRKTIPSDVIASQQAADNLAAIKYLEFRLPVEVISVQMQQRPDLEYGHLVTVRSDDAGVAGQARVAGWTIPIGSRNSKPGLMTVDFLARSVA